MQPIQDLLRRIAWDPEFGRGRFALGYEDRMRPDEAVVALEAVHLDRRRPGSVAIEQADGLTVHVPLHRIRTVYKNGEVIWRRPPPRGRA